MGQCSAAAVPLTLCVAASSCCRVQLLSFAHAVPLSALQHNQQNNGVELYGNGRVSVVACVTAAAVWATRLLSLLLRTTQSTS